MAKDSNKKEDLRTLGFNPSIYFNSYAMGGDLEEGTPDLSAYETTYGDLPPEVVKYMNMPGANPDKILQWFNLGISEPQTFNQARLLAEAVGYNPEQAKVVAAQWQMESSGGSRLSSPYNYFGIKSHNESVRNRLAERGINVSTGKEAGTTEVVDGKKVSKNASFMEFNNAFEGFAAHRAFLETNARYSKALAAGTAKEFALGLEKAGYATAPNYGTRLYQDYVAPKEKNPKAGDSRPKSLGETKSQKIKPYTFEPASMASEPQGIPMLPPAMLEASPVMPLDPTTTEGMYGSVPFQQKVEETKAIPVDAPAGFFGSGKTMFKQGGSMNFKSPGAYQKWLGYVHATGLAESTPGHQKVSIGGKPHKVEHQYGGRMYAAGGSFNNPGFNALPTEVQNKIKANAFAEGGSMGNQLTQFDGGFKHDDPNPQNVFSGIPQGFAPDQRMNVAEKDETKFENYIFSDNLKVTKDIAEAFNLPKNTINKTYADVSKNLNLNKSRRENDTIEDKHKEKMLNTLREAQETFKAEEEAKDFAMMAEKYPEKMAAMMQAMQAAEAAQGGQGVAPGGQMMEAPAGEIAAAGMNPAQEMPSPEPVPTSQLPMSYGGSMYMMGGKMCGYGGNMYDFGGWMDDNSGAISGAGTGALSGAGTGATIGSVVPGIGTAIGAGVGALIGGIAGGVSGSKKDKQEQAAEDLAQQEQLAQGNQMQQIQNPAYVTPAAQYALNAGMPAITEMPGSTYMAKNGGPLHHQYPQLSPMWKNNAGPMGQGLANTQVYAMGGHMYVDGGDPDVGNYDVDTTLTDTTQDLSVTGTPLGLLTNLAPIAYNTYQALSKPKTYKPDDFYVRQEAIRPDYTQAENEARYSYAQLMDSLGASGLSGGNYMSNAQQAANVRNKGMAAVAMAEENAYREDQARVRAANALAETDAKKLALQTNWAQQAARQESGKEAINQAKAITDADLANELAYNYAIMGAPDITRFKKIGYTPYGEYFRERYLTRKKKGE